MEWSEFQTWLFLALLTFLGGAAVSILWSMNQSIHDLNVKMGAVLEKLGFHEKEISRIDQGLSRIQDRLNV
jgi:hypothetical protein